MEEIQEENGSNEQNLVSNIKCLICDVKVDEVTTSEEIKLFEQLIGQKVNFSFDFIYDQI